MKIKYDIVNKSRLLMTTTLPRLNLISLAVYVLLQNLGLSCCLCFYVIGEFNEDLFFVVVFRALVS